MNDTDVDFDLFVKETKHFPAKFPEALYKLRRDCLNIERQVKFKPGHLKELIKEMSVDEERHKTLFMQLLCYYYIEQFAMCSSNSKVLRPTFWRYVTDMEAFEQVNWPKAIHSHLMDAISDMHRMLVDDQQGSAVQHSFRGCAPILEAIVFERIPSLQTKIETLIPPPIQKYPSHRNTTEGWRTGLLGREITPCPYCTSHTCTPPSGSSLTLHSPLITPPSSSGTRISCTPQSPIHSRDLFEEGYDAMREGFSTLELTPQREGHEMPAGETEDEVPVVELSPSPEEEKPKCDLLFLLEHAMKPNSREEVSPEDRQHLDNAASILKSQLVTRLTNSADNLRTEDMIILANRCYNTLRELGDDYRSFSREVNRIIAQQQQLEFAAKDIENWNDWDLKARYIHQAQLLSDATEKLSRAQDNLSGTLSQVYFLKVKKDELEVALLMVTEELSEEEERAKNLTEERDQCQEVHFDLEVGFQKLDAEKKEASAALEAINAKYNAAKEEFERMTNQLLQLVWSRSK